MIRQFFTWFTSPHDALVEPLYKVREVWMYAHIDPQTRRVTECPVLIYRRASDGMFWGLLLSNVGTRGKKLYVPRLRNGRKGSPLSEMRTLKAERLIRRVGVASEQEFGTLTASIIRRLVHTEVSPTVRLAQQYARTRRAPRTYVFGNPYTLVPRT